MQCSKNLQHFTDIFVVEGKKVAPNHKKVCKLGTFVELYHIHFKLFFFTACVAECLQIGPNQKLTNQWKGLLFFSIMLKLSIVLS